MMRFALSCLSFCAWMVVPFILYGGYQLFGLPHLIWTYQYETTARSRMDFERRWYTSCTFIGPFGAFTVPADRGRCAWVAFFHPREAGQ